MTGPRPITDEDWAHAKILWAYHQLGHKPQAADVAIGLGCHDLGVATFAAELYALCMFPRLVFSGADNPIRAHLFPRGEAVGFKERAVELGVPPDVILVEPSARNTGENLTFSRALLDAAGLRPRSALLISMPYRQRRTYATCRKIWPEVQPICVSVPWEFSDYVDSIGDGHMVISQLVGDTQRLLVYPKLGFTIPQDLPKDVQTAYIYLIAAGYRARLLADHTP
ncbi:MAG: YdcF family protein [Terriglobales bacterium]